MSKEVPSYTEATVCFPVRGSEVLLAVKQKKIGAGYLNGFGGRFEPTDASIEETNRRETLEEAGIQIAEARKVGEVCFHNPSPEEYLQRVRLHFFIATQWLGEPVSTDEMMHPEWFAVDSIDYERFLPADRHFIPRMLKGEKLSGDVYYNSDWSIDSVDIKPVDTWVESPPHA